jgi:predicted TIM-barrel enzyme
MMTLLLHVCGLTRAGSFGAKTSVSLEEKSVQEIADAASEVNPDVIVFFHGHLSL